MLLDILAGVICVILAACFATINILTNPKRRHWLDFPAWVRAPLFFAAGSCLYCGTDLLSAAMAGAPPSLPPMVILAFVGTGPSVAVMTAYILVRTYPIRVWDRLKWIERKVSCRDDDDDIPVMVPRSRVFDLFGGADFVVPPSPGGLDDASERGQQPSLH